MTTGEPTSLGAARALLRRNLSFARYVLVGAFNTLLDIGIFTLQVTVLHVPPLAANVVSTAVTMCVSYVLNRSFVFSSDRSHAKAAVPFVVVTLTSGLLVQSLVIAAVMAGGAALLDVPHGLLATGAKVVAVGVGIGINYVGYRLIFRGSAWRRRAHHEAASALSAQRTRDGQDRVSPSAAP